MFRALRAFRFLGAIALVVSVTPMGAWPAVQTPAFDNWHLLAELPQGHAAGQVGYQLHVQGGIPRGPQAVSVAPNGTLYVLDSLLQRAHVLENTGQFVRTTDLPIAGYVRELLATNDELFALSEDGVIVRTDTDGVLLASYQLPSGMRSQDVLRLAVGQDGSPVLWATGYRELRIGALPGTIDLQTPLESKDRSGRGLAGPDGRRYLGELNGPTAGRLVTSAGAGVAEFSARGYFGSARPIGFDGNGRIYFVVEDLFDSSPIRVEASLRAYSPAGVLTGAARLPVEEYVLSPARAVDVHASGVAYAIVPRSAGVSVYRVALGQSYRSAIASRGVSPDRAARPKANAMARPLESSISLTRKQVSQRAMTMADTSWQWSWNYDRFSNGVSRGSYTRAAQLGSATEGQTFTGIPYTWGGFDSAWSHTDGSVWSTWGGALTPANYGPLVSNISTNFAGGDSAGIDCSGLIYAAAGKTSNPKKGTSHLMESQNSENAGWEAGGGGNVQPMNYFVNSAHTFYYDFRILDASGIYTVEATTDGSVDAAKRWSRTWTDVNGYQHRSWWLFDNGDTAAKALTGKGAHSACYGVRGQNVWYKYTAAGAHSVTLTSISGGDPDLWVLDANLNLVGSSTFTNQTNETVNVGSGGTYYVFVHIWRSDSGTCVYYTINW